MSVVFFPLGTDAIFDQRINPNFFQFHSSPIYVYLEKSSSFVNLHSCFELEFEKKRAKKAEKLW